MDRPGMNLIVATAVCLAMLAPTGCARRTIAAREMDSESRLQRLSDTPVGSRSHYVLQFINADEGLLANGEKLWRTTNGGRSWSLRYKGEDKRGASWNADSSIEKLMFINSKIGWVVLSPGGIYKTEDAGATWKPQSDPFLDGAVYSIKFFKDGKRGWAAGVINQVPPRQDHREFPADDYCAVIAQTQNGGITWQRHAMANTRIILDLYFNDENDGWALGWPGLFRLDGESNSWKEVDFQKSECDSGMLQDALDPKNVVHEATALDFVDSSLGWISFKNGLVVRTTDGGRTWCDLLNPRDIWPATSVNGYFEKIHFIDSKRGWGLGCDSLYETADGGFTWKRIDMAFEFKDLFFLDGNKGWAVAKEGVFQLVAR